MIDGRLMQDERMIGDDDIGLAGGTHGALDEAFAVMRAGGIDAFAAPVGEAERAPARDCGLRRRRLSSLKSDNSQEGKSPPTMSPSRLACAQRAMSAASKRRARLSLPSCGRRLPAC